MNKTTVLFLIFTSLALSVLISFPSAASPQEQTGVRIAGAKDEIPDWVARWELAKVLSYTKRYNESLAEYRKLIKEKPDLYEARLEMANVLFWMGQRNEAVKILEGTPKSAMDDKSRLLMADIYVTQKEYGKAEQLYRDYLAKHPGDQKTRFKLAQALSWDKKYDASIAEYRIILDALPDDIQVRRKYAFVLIWAGRHKEAATELKKTLK